MENIVNNNNIIKENEKSILEENKQKSIDEAKIKNKLLNNKEILGKSKTIKVNNESQKLINYTKNRDINNNNNNNYINKSIVLQEQINCLSNRNQIMKNKLSIFLKLMKQYSNKLNTLIINNDKNTNEEDIINTLSRLNNMLNDPKLKDDVFEITQILLDDLSKNNILNNGNIYKDLSLNELYEDQKDIKRFSWWKFQDSYDSQYFTFYI